MNRKNKKDKNPGLRKVPFYLRKSFTNLLNRASTSEENLNESSCSDSNEPNCSISNTIENPGQDKTSSANLTQNVEPPNIPNDKMAVNPAVDPTISVFNSLKIPDAVKDLPKFDGNPRLLYDFIDNVEEILALSCAVDGTPYGRVILRAIRNKIEGPANEVLNMYGTPLEWEAIKNNLVLHYSDKRNETSLIRDLHNLKQSNKTVETFYRELIELQATMSNHIHLHEKDEKVVEAKKNLFSEMCLNVYLSGLKEPLGSTIRAMQPKTLPEAFTFCIKEQNIFYAKWEQPNFHQKPKLTRASQPPRPLNLPPRLPWTGTALQSPNFPQHSYNQNYNRPANPSFNRPPNQPFNRPFNYSPQIHQRQQTNQQFRPFASNPFNRPNLPKPEPMDTSSGLSRLRQQPQHSSRPNNTQFNRTPKFTSEELFNLDEQIPPIGNDSNIYTNDHYYTNLDRYCENYTEPNTPNEITHRSSELNEENFPPSASPNLSDT